MDTTRICPGCQKTLAPGLPLGLCPECLIRAGFNTGTETGPAPADKPRFQPPTLAELSKHFPQLEILEFIGQGGMGAVYKARQKQLDRTVALKILPPQVASGPGFAERFTREVRALAKLNHPHIVTLYEFGQTDGLFYFLMEFVDGVNLRQLLNNSRISPPEALAIVPQICDALQYAHDRGIVHRDIKPENIMLNKDGDVKIADFGVAKIVEDPDQAGIHAPGESGELTEAGSVLGTPQYMAPEQVAHPLAVDHRADIYALGVVFYQMLTGELPAGKFDPPSRKVQIDVRLDEVVLRALENKPELRYQQAGELKTHVETILTTPPKTPLTQKESKPMNKKTAAAIAIVVLLLTAAGYASWFTLSQPDQKNPTVSEPVQTNQNDQDTFAATNQSGFQMTIELRDGSRVVGKGLDDTLSFHSASLGDLKLAVSGIRSIAMAEDGVTARVTEANGDVLDVQSITPALRVETGFGKTDLPVKLVRSLTISPIGAPGQTYPGVLAGPIINPANGHSYYLLETNSWVGSEALAVALGGHLATIRDAAEQGWVYNTFSTYGGKKYNLWIGLYDPSQDANGLPHAANFTWADGETAPYRNWSAGEPNNYDGHQWYAYIFAPDDSRASFWDDGDNENVGTQINGVAEVAGTPNTLTLPRPTVPVRVASTNETGYQMTIELRDGSRVVGKGLDDKLSFHSASLGDLKLSLAGIRAIDLAADGVTARVTEANGDVLDVQFTTSTLRVLTGFGKTELPVKLIKSIRVSAVSNPGQMPSGLVALWSGEGNADDSVGGNNGQLVGNIGFMPGKVGQAFNFNNGIGAVNFPRVIFSQDFSLNRGGGYGYVQIPASPALDVGKGDGFTFECWIKPVSVTQRMLIAEYERALGTYDWADVGFNFGIHPSSVLDANLVDDTANHSAHEIITPPNLLIADVWQHIALTYDKASGIAVIYINGAVAVQSNLGSFTPQTGFPYLLVGARTTFGSVSNPQDVFSGGMDEIGIYNRALSAEEIQTIYNSGNSIISVPPPANPPKPNIPTTLTTTNETGFGLTIELRDGSRVAGKSLDESLRFHSASLGDMKFSVADIRAIVMADDGVTARLTATNGDMLDVQFVTPTLRVETGFGKTELPVKLIRRVRFSAEGHPSQMLSGLVALWSGEGNADDSTGENNGVLADGVSFEPGVVGQAFHFNGNDNSYVKVADSPSLRLTDVLTISFWFKKLQLNGRPYGEYIINKGGDWSRGGLDYGVATDPDSIGTGIAFLFAGGNRHAGSITDTNWHYCAIIATNGEPDPVFYIDGMFQPIMRREGSSTINLYPSTQPLYIGAQVDPNSGYFYYSKTLIDELAIYNRSLSADEIQTIYNSGQPSSPALPPPLESPVWQTVKTDHVPSTVTITNETGFRLTIDLRDGSHVVGKSLADALRFHSASLGDMKLAVAGIHSIEMADDGVTARLTATNGDMLDVQFVTPALRVETDFGKTELPVQLIRSIKVLAMTRPGQLPSGLVSLWSGEGNANDSVGGNNGTLMNGVGFADAVVGEGFSFSGKNQSVVIPHSLSLVTPSFSVEAWVKPSSQITDSEGQTVIFGQSYGRCDLLVRRGTTGLYAAWQIGTDRFTFYDVVSTTEIPIGQFSHLVGTWDGTMLRLYVNGVLSAQRPVAAAPVDSGCPFYIGGFYSPAPDDCQTVSQFFNGIIDEAGYFNRALSPSEIQSICTMQNGGIPLPPPPTPVFKKMPGIALPGRLMIDDID